MSKNKFLHEELYRGKDLFEKLSQKKILLCGVGALGSNLSDNLTRIGFSRINVLDFDRVEESNVSTQLYGEQDVGALKVNALKNIIFNTSGVEIEVINKELTLDNAKKLLKGYDLVLDLFDNSKSRKIVQETTRSLKVSCLHAGLFEDYGQVTWDERYLIPKDVIGDVCEYPLARNLISLVVAITSEEILDFCLSDKPRKSGWTITLKDLSIRKM